ncbi:MAG TPA: M48 family metalloprotease [Planctomycetota bacterium]|nr:M48 family metalloprotease [Planctomycetota bacterium]
MIPLLLGLGGALFLAALADVLPLHDDPVPAGWALAAAAFPLAARAIRRVLRLRSSRLVRLAAFVLADYSILYPLGWAKWSLVDLGWQGQPLQSLLLLLAPAAMLALWLAPWAFFEDFGPIPVGDPSARGRAGASGAFLRWLARTARILLVPLGVFVGAVGAAEALWSIPAAADALDSHPSLQAAAAAIALLVLIALSPYLLLLAWPTSPFPAGPLLDRFESIARILRAPLRGVRIWDERTRHVWNACAVGLLPGTQRVIFTRGILDHLDVEELAGVFAHEAAHIGRGHIASYSILAAAFMLCAAPLEHALALFPAWAAAGLVTVHIAVWWLILFPFAARRLELEADLAAADVTGTDAYERALRKVAVHLGPGARKNGLRHLSVERRILHLEASRTDPLRRRSFLRSCRGLRISLRVLLIVSWAALGASLWAEIRRPAAVVAVERAERLVEDAARLEVLRQEMSLHAAGARASWLARPDSSIAAEAAALLERARAHAARAEAGEGADPERLAILRERIADARGFAPVR